MKKTHKLTRERLCELLHYDPTTGIFRWRMRSGRHGRIPAGSIAGCNNKIHEYHEIWCDKVLYKAHCLAWLYINGVWPKNEMDHINQKRSDNRWCNLREATLQQNLKNKALYKSNTTGCSGVTLHKGSGKYLARIGYDCKRIHLGYFEKLFDAETSYKEAKAKFHAFNVGA